MTVEEFLATFECDWNDNFANTASADTTWTVKDVAEGIAAALRLRGQRAWVEGTSVFIDMSGPPPPVVAYIQIS